MCNSIGLRRCPPARFQRADAPEGYQTRRQCDPTGVGNGAAAELVETGEELAAKNPTGDLGLEGETGLQRIDPWGAIGSQTGGRNGATAIRMPQELPIPGVRKGTPPPHTE
jgi:hypothetical protein